MYSRPVAVDVAVAQPTVFLSESSPPLPLIYDVPPDGSAPFPVTSEHPAKAGDKLVIYCAGLGRTDPLLADRAATPYDPIARTRDACMSRSEVSLPR
jgi:uncharacterized protein (TIGR03437 family)